MNGLCIMSKPTNYDLLLQINTSVNRLEDKLDNKIVGNTKKIDKLETKVDNLLGKIGIGIMIMSAAIAGTITLLIDLIKSKLIK